MTEPTDAEIIALADETRTAEGGASGYILPISFARAVLAKWGTPPAVAGEPVMWAYQYSDGSWHDASATEHSAGMKPLYTTPQPTQPQAGAVPLTPIRKAALDLYTPPFRCEHGYVRDANNQMVADDSGEEMVGVIAARIRGWGRIKYMDNPKGHAAALQDEVGEIVAQALNEHWATHGIKGGQHGAE